VLSGYALPGWDRSGALRDSSMVGHDVRRAQKRAEPPEIVARVRDQ
jgi:hypothetical protein